MYFFILISKDNCILKNLELIEGDFYIIYINYIAYFNFDIPYLCKHKYDYP